MSTSSRLKRRQILSSRRTLALLFLCVGASIFIGFGKLFRVSSINRSDARLFTTNEAMSACPPPPRIHSSSSSDSNNSNNSSGNSSRTATDFGFLCQDPAVSYLQIAAPPVMVDEEDGKQKRPSPRILCLVLTQSKNHATRMQAVVDTWGRKCDTLIAASNKTDPALHTYRIESTKGYWGIWDKLMQTLRLIVEGDSLLQVQLDEYDWILKADDDTYVIMENLRAFLANVTHHNSDDPNKENVDDEPRIYGRTMAWPRLKRFREMRGWFDDKSSAINREFAKRFYSKLDDSLTLRFSHGGPGYVMNRKYAQILVQAYFNMTSDGSYDAVKGEVAEDIANAVTMLYHGIRPGSTADMDAGGRERMHPESPQTMYANPIWLERMHHGMKLSVQGEGEQCCSPRSISYHYVADFQMRLLDYQLYQCPNENRGRVQIG